MSQVMNVGVMNVGQSVFAQYSGEKNVEQCTVIHNKIESCGGHRAVGPHLQAQNFQITHNNIVTISCTQ